MGARGHCFVLPFHEVFVFFTEHELPTWHRIWSWPGKKTRQRPCDYHISFQLYVYTGLRWPQTPSMYFSLQLGRVILQKSDFFASGWTVGLTILWGFHDFTLPSVDVFPLVLGKFSCCCFKQLHHIGHSLQNALAKVRGHSSRGLPACHRTWHVWEKNTSKAMWLSLVDVCSATACFDGCHFKSKF